jgi:tetratricopeptide (TPR) repeat protein
VPPLEETTELYEAILDEDLPPAPGAPRRVKAETPARRPTQPDLIDRNEELVALHRAFRQATGGRGQLLAVTGAPWMGKTRLLEELASSVGEEAHVLFGRAFRMEQNLPYGVVTQVLTAASPAIEAADGIPQWAHHELARLVPGFGPGQDGTSPDRFGELRLLEGIYTALSALATLRPVVLILDDAQWMDQASAAMFSYLARRIGDLPVLMVVAARTGDDLIPAVAEMMTGAESLEIGPLGVVHLTELTKGDQAEAARLLAKTGGVPLLVDEASRPGADSTTPGMARYMEARLLEVGDLARQILTAAAALNGICDVGLLRATSGRSEEEVVEAVEELLVARLLREVPESGGLAFTLDALERVTYDATSMVRRRLLHRRAARALAERGHARSDVRMAVAVAGQFQAAGDAEAAEWFHLAGDLSRAVYAHESAREFYEAALALGDPDVTGARISLAEIAMASGEYDRARRELTLAAAHATPEVTGVLEHRAGEVERLLGRFQDAEAHFERAIHTHPVPAEVLADWSLLAHRVGDASRAADLADRARAAAEENGSRGQQSRVRNILAIVTADGDEALAHADEALRLGGDDELLRMAALNNKAALLSEDGGTEAAVTLVEEAIGIAQRTGHRHREAALWNHLADLHHRAGREAEARDALNRAVSLFADIDSGDLEPELWLLSRW